ncbi:diuretic hormone receptor [Trichonephila inaurata madagascariensis]|uniref:Diuretic hormone receptor n=1 Tax=Trichonephila inaurata madagascariensis TaxID=2747483 RepID=A0A8X7CRA8_9ARAC|nr:diuretic hormone receptor [Trichonephila inaurata madagascariensis]
MRDAVTVYYVGYGISLIALSLALWIFMYFKELRCLRNTIHANLMFTYLLLDITWICTAKLQSSQNYIANRIACFLTIFLTYLMGTNFFWMFVEGLYLFILVVKTFTVDNIKMYVYALIGWVSPALVVAIWAGVKGHIGNSIEDVLAPQGCPWQRRDYYDYIFISPVILVLLSCIHQQYKLLSEHLKSYSIDILGKLYFLSNWAVYFRSEEQTAHKKCKSICARVKKQKRIA